MINFDLSGLGPMFQAGPLLNPTGTFSTTYRCYSIVMYSQSHVSDERVAEMENGGKILLPHSALDYLTRLHIDYPMMFKITNPNPKCQRVTHSGVMEFHQDEGKCYMPHWMMRNLLLSEGDYIQVDYVRLPVATYVKFEPQSVDFLDITNPRAVLELRLRNFSCLTKSDMIAISYNNKIYELLVQDLKPANAVSIVECDMNVEFSPPVGYVEPERQPKPAVHDHAAILSENAAAAAAVVGNKFVPFQGKGFRSDGKDKHGESSKASSALENALKTINKENIRGIPNYNYKPGKLKFIRTPVPKFANGDTASKDAEFVPFGGTGQKLRDRKK